jgi:glycosyltransferase involved in cell wall biosynthesis
MLSGMEVTACICSHNRPAYLRDCLAGLVCQTVGPDRFDILVVDSASTPDAAAQMVRLVAGLPNTRLLRLEQAGVSFARNAGAAATRSDFIAYIDDDAVPASDWIERIREAIGATDAPPAMIGGRIVPRWEVPLPAWWPRQLRGILSLVEFEGEGEYRTAALPRGMEPYGANMVVHLPSLHAVGGFGRCSGRVRKVLLSDEEVQLAWRLQAAGCSVRYDSRIVVEHQIQADRLTPGWLLSRLYWQGASAVLTRRLLGESGAVWRELPRRLGVLALLAISGLLPRRSTRLLPLRWRLAYAAGFVGAAFGLVRLPRG